MSLARCKMTPNKLLLRQACAIASDHQHDELQVLLERHPSLAFERSSNHYTLLHHVASRGDDRTARILLRSGADVDARTKVIGRTPLMIAAEKRNVRVLSELLIAGADPNLRDVHRTTALAESAASCDAACVDVLLVHGARVDLQASFQTTPLVFAARKLRGARADDARRVVDLLLRAGADPYATNFFERDASALLAARLGDVG